MVECLDPSHWAALCDARCVQEGIRALTKAMLVRPEQPIALTLQHASFTKIADRGHHAEQALKVDPVNPDGNYKFDLSHPAQRQVAIDLIKCAPVCRRTHTGVHACLWPPGAMCACTI